MSCVVATTHSDSDITIHDCKKGSSQCRCSPAGRRSSVPSLMSNAEIGSSSFRPLYSTVSVSVSAEGALACPKANIMSFPLPDLSHIS